MIIRVTAGSVSAPDEPAAVRSAINGGEEPAHLPLAKEETRDGRMERTMEEESVYLRKCFILSVSLRADPESSRILRVSVRTGRSASASVRHQTRTLPALELRSCPRCRHKARAGSPPSRRRLFRRSQTDTVGPLRHLVQPRAGSRRISASKSCREKSRT